MASRFAAGGRARRMAVCAGLACALAPMLPVAAASADDTLTDYEKDQVVYVKADANGGADGVYVVNRFVAPKDGEIVDQGRYDEVANLTDTQEVTSRRGEVAFDVTKEEPFYYQGSLSSATELPWKIEVTYFLDGDEVDADELAGAEGHLKMVFAVGPNEDASEDSDARSYADAYLLQVTTALDGDLASDVVAEDAVVAAAGNDTQLTYLVFPGKGASYTVEADVEDFEFDGWQIVAVPLALSMEVDASEALEGNADLAALTDGAADVDEGARSVADGASNLAEGSATYRDGLAGQASEARSAAGEVDVASAQAAYEQALQDYLAAYGQCIAYGGDPTVDETAVAAQGAMQDALTAYVTAQSTAAGYTSAADALEGAAGGYAQVDEGIAELADGASDLTDGTGELAAATADLDGQVAGAVQDAVHDYLNPAFTPVDFVNGQTDVIDSVQFVIATEAIEAPGDDDAAADGVGATGKDEAGETFWEKLAALFK